jgi:hypothetical protein
MADLTELGRCTKTGRLSVQSGELKRAPKPSEHRFSYMRAMNCSRHHGSEFSLNRASLMHVQTTTIKPRPSCIGILCVLPRISTLCTQSVCRTLVSLGGPTVLSSKVCRAGHHTCKLKYPKTGKFLNPCTKILALYSLPHDSFNPIANSCTN